jgi:Zn-dependent peptidase ImmA (M78 family)
MTAAPVDGLEEKLKNHLQRWRNGEKAPTFAQIETLSKATRIPLGYFFLDTPPREDYNVLKFRTIDSETKKQSSRELLDVIAQMEIIQEWMRDHLILEGKGALPFVNSLGPNMDVEKIVLDIRKTIQIDADWYSQREKPNRFKVLKKALSEAGILVMASGVAAANTHRPLDIEEFRAFTLVDEYAPLIFINTNDSESGRLFSLLHETAHIWIGIDSVYDNRLYFTNHSGNTEQFCNAVAAELFVPNEAFREKWRNTNIKTRKRDIIKNLANKFGCSTIIIARRALDNGFINDGQYAMAVQEAIAHFVDAEKKKAKDGGDFYATNAARMDHNFILALDSSVREGRTLSTDAYRLTNTTRKTFPGLVKKIAGQQN